MNDNHKTHDIKISLERGGMYPYRDVDLDTLEYVAEIAAETASRVCLEMCSTQALKDLDHIDAMRLKNLDPNIDMRDKDVHMFLPHNNVRNDDMFQLCFIAGRPENDSGVGERRICKTFKSNKTNIEVYFYGSKYFDGEIDYIMKSDTIKKIGKYITSAKYKSYFNASNYNMHIAKRFCPNCKSIAYDVYLWSIYVLNEDVLNSYLLPQSDFIADIYINVPDVLAVNVPESDGFVDNFYRSVLQITFESDYTEKHISPEEIANKYAYEIAVFNQNQEHEENGNKEDAES